MGKGKIPFCSILLLKVMSKANTDKATKLSWTKDEQRYERKETNLGIYFLRMSLLFEDEVMIWNIYYFFLF
jgi:hypothetical protein